jgi:flagellum-specific peptidoglycan hydrolase FlgJ
MKLKKLVILLVMGFLSFSAKSQSSYFKKYKPLCDTLESKYGIPSSVMMAIAYHESGGGVSRNAKLLNNHFGIVGSNNLLKTHGIKSKYKYFATDTAGYVGFCDLVARKKFYTNLKGSSSYSKWVYSIHAAGYCPSQSWPGTVISIIKKYDLD